MLSKSVEYALKSLIIINESDSSINIDDICNNLDIPKSFTAKLLMILTKKGYITSKKGPGGGFKRNDYERTIKDVIIDIDGDFKYDRCSLGLSKCSNETPCPMHDYFKPIKDKILTEFMIVTISELCNNPNKILKI